MNREYILRVGFFFGIFVMIALWEAVAARRKLGSPKAERWISNLGIVFLNTLVVYWLFPVTAVGLAALSQERSWGLLNNFPLPAAPALILGVVSMDLAIYLQHVMFHAVPILWRLHRVHHVDLDFDVTTGLRFHPLEIALSMLIKLAVVVMLGPSPIAVLVFEILLNGTAMFNHGNIRIPQSVDRALRLFVVTPDMHRVHHSILVRETNSNFGFNLPWWDRLFGTYRSQPTAGHEGMTIGISDFRDRRRWSLPWMLALPFIGEAGIYPFAGRTDPGRSP
ncbi:MAG: sterol desaturase family protein [Elusimicrobiota bacterium]